LQKTLMGSVTVLSELLAVANPLSFNAGLRCRDYVASIAKALRLPNPWQYEIAALMSQIGCVTLPDDTLNKLYSGLKLTDEEQAMYDNHPLIGASLLEKIPRLENVTRMIRLQLTRFDKYTEAMVGAEFEEVLIGGMMLKAALDFDRYLFRGMRRNEAVEVMRRQKKMYNPKILDIISKLKIERRDRQELNLTVQQISVGMVAAENIMAKNGVLIIPKGQTITKLLLQGLKNFSLQVRVVEPLRVLIGQSFDSDSARDDVIK